MDGPTEIDGGDQAPCARDLDCSDSVFCNGMERCMPGASGALANGCLPGAQPCGTGEQCDEEGARCETRPCDGTAENGCPNADADCDGDRRPECGGGADCDDTTATQSSLNAEVCDVEGLDEDCNLTTVYDVVNNDGDVDGDGRIDEACFNRAPDGSERNRGTDCNDDQALIFPGAIENCNGVNDDCDTMIDEGLVITYYRDFDGDGHGNPLETTSACAPSLGWVSSNDDCDDRNEMAFLGAIEANYPCDRADNDCDEEIDEAGNDQVTCYVDGDEDFYGRAADPQEFCFACPSGYVGNSTDCDDSNPLVHPGASYQTTPYCPAGFPACTGGCRNTLACVPGTICPCVSNLLEWDYNCNNVINVVPRPTCCTIPPCPNLTTGPRDAETEGSCGLDVPAITIANFNGCMTTETGTIKLGCR